jgi:putative endonuclease
MVFDHHKTQTAKFIYSRVECPELVEGLSYVYILECSYNSLYTGSTENLKSRKKTHDAGKAAEWTKDRRPVQLVYFETHDSLLEARRRELQIKGWVRKKKENLILGKWGKV